MINYVEVVELFATGYACGIVLSVLSLIFGMLIGLAIKLMKGDAPIC